MNAAGDRADIVTAVLRRNGRILLCHRTPRRQAFPNLWGLPGGHIDPGEAAESALVRELAEELGITIPQPSHAPAMVFATDELRMRVWLIQAWTGIPTNLAPEEHDRLIWADLDQALDLDLAHPDHYHPLFTDLLAEPEITN
jgi:mutator protein MutT